MTRIANGDLLLQGQTNPADDEAIPVELFLQVFTSGTKFEWVSNSQVRLVPSGIDGKARIGMYDGSTLMGFVTSSNITADITSSGANGLDTGAEAASTFYLVWAIGKSDGTLALLLSVSTTAPTMPSGYTFKRLLWGVANDGSSNFCTFDHLKDGKCLYTVTQSNSVRGIAILSGGTATTATAITLVAAAPAVDWVTMGTWMRASNTSTTGSVMVVSEESAQTVRPFTSRTAGNIVGGTNAEHWEPPLRNTGSLATSLYYSWSAATTTRSADFFLQWWSIGTRW